MNVRKAVEIVNSKMPGRTAIGYWKTKDGLVINLRPEAPKGVCGEICYILVKRDGSVSATNPMRSVLDSKKRIPL